jgi:hypothetical protein
VKYTIRTRFNPYHVPAGGPGGGQFTTGGSQPGSFPIEQIDPKTMADVFANNPLPDHKLSDAEQNQLDDWFDPLDVASWEHVDLSCQTVAEMDRLMDRLRANPDSHPNIMQLTVAGERIFHPEKALDLRRDQMPQIPSKARDDFLSTLPHETVSIDPRTLYPTQNELDGYKVALFAARTNAYDVVPLVSKDNYVIDGHHNWAGAVVRRVDGENNLITVNRVDMNRDDLLAASRTYADANGFAAKPIHKYMIKAKFNPNHVPAGRPEGGQFASVQMITDAAAMDEFDAIFGPFTKVEYGHLTFNEGPNAGDMHRQLFPEALQWMADHPAVAQSILDYIGTGYGPLNSYLRTGKALSKSGIMMSPGEARSMASRLERGLEEAPVLPDGTVLYRAFRSDAVIERANNGGLVDGVFHDKAFLSTSLDTGTLRNFYEDKMNKSNAVLMRITTRDGARGALTQASLGGIAYERPGEYEVLLNKSTDLYVTKVTPLKTGGIVVDADVYGDTSKVMRFNPNHVPAGDPAGGQFTSFHDVFPDSPYYVAGQFTRHSTEEANAAHKAMATSHVAYRQGLDLADRLELADYRDNGYRPLNSFLRYGPDGIEGSSDIVLSEWYHDDRVAGFTKYADDLSRIVQGAPVHPDLTVYRAFRSDELQAVADHLEGTNITEKGFMSTSLSSKMVGSWFGGRVGDDNAVGVRLQIPTKVPALYLPDNIDDPYEYEVLLDRDTSIRVTNVTKLKEGGILIDATAMPK